MNVVFDSLGHEISGNFYVLSYEEGLAKDLIDFVYARNRSIVDGVYCNDGPGFELMVAENFLVKQQSTRGFMLCYFMVTANSPQELFENMKQIREKVILSQDHPDLQIMEPNVTK